MKQSYLANKEFLDQNILEESNQKNQGGQKPPQISKWLILGLILLIILFGGYFYFQGAFVQKKKVEPTPAITEAPWKTKSEKTVNDFLNYWGQTNNSQEDDSQAKKARDLLTINLQARMETLKDDQGQPIDNISDRLNKLIGVKAQTTKYDTIIATKIDEQTVEVRIRLIYSKNITKNFIVKEIDKVWLIDEINDYLSSPQPTATLTISPTSTNSNNSTISPSPTKS